MSVSEDVIALVAPSGTPDSGWCGDRRRGASMGRSSEGSDPEGIVYFGRVYLDEGGYDPGGAYWGAGTPVYEAYADGFYRTVRAKDDEDAKRQFAEDAPEAELVLRADLSVDIQAFTDSFITALFWSSTISGDDEISADCACECDLSDDARASIAEECERFAREHFADIAGNADNAGHDFALTRNHHGAGFWDGDWPKDVGERLTEASRAFGECNLYLGDDGKVYLE